MAQNAIQFVTSDTPVIFSPGIVSDGYANRDMAISPDGNDMFYTLQWYFGLYSVILHTHKINDAWSNPDTAWFSGKYNDLEPAFSPDGNKLFFVSNRPIYKSDSTKDYDIWYLQKRGINWEGPFNLGAPVNSQEDEFYPCVTGNGNIYFTRNHGDAGDDIYFSEFSLGKYQAPNPLPATINSMGDDFNAFVDPDEKYIIFSSAKRKDDLGRGDLYYALRSDSIWQPAAHFKNGINSTVLDYSPFVTSDRKFFFFTSKRTTAKFPFSQAKDFRQIESIFNSCGNGFEDIYIMNFKEIEKLLYPSLSSLH
jgi:WD40-like Beta Propeller Repeat